MEPQPNRRPTARPIGRPSKSEPFRALVAAVLAKEPDLPSTEILRRAVRAGYQGGKSALYDLIAALRPPPGRARLHLEAQPGQLSQHDFGQAQLRFRDAGWQTVSFLVSRLAYSGWTEVSLLPDEEVESLIRGIVEHFAAMGGVPARARLHRTGALALAEEDGRVTDWHPAFAHAAVELGVGVDVLPAAGEDGTASDDLGEWLKRSFLAERVFLDAADLRHQLETWLHETNSSARDPGGAVPAVLLAEERYRMRPVPTAPNEFAVRLPFFVAPNRAIQYRGKTYELPPESLGAAGTLYLYRDRVRIVVGSLTLTYEREDGAPEAPL